MDVGFIGLGKIGTPMVLRLLEAGHRVTVSARGQGLAAAVASGAAVTANVAALAASSELLVVCVFTDDQVRAAVLDSGCLTALCPGAVLAVHTTGSPALVRALADAVPAGVEVIDAAFSGGPGEVAAGTLTLMVGGSDAAVARALPALSAYAGAVHHVGELGRGQTAKLLNNLLFATNVMNAARVLTLAEEQGMDGAAVAAILQQCSAASFALDRFAGARPPAEVVRALAPFLAKDVAVALASAAGAGLDAAPFAETQAFFATSLPVDR